MSAATTNTSKTLKAIKLLHRSQEALEFVLVGYKKFSRHFLTHHDFVSLGTQTRVIVADVLLQIHCDIHDFIPTRRGGTGAYRAVSALGVISIDRSFMNIWGNN